MKVKVSEAKDQVLDYLVAKCQGIELTGGRYNRLLVDGHMSRGQEMMTHYKPTIDWAQGGVIIESEGISLECDEFARWHANGGWSSDTPLLSAMRCYVVSKLGGEVEVPDEFK